VLPQAGDTADLVLDEDDLADLEVRGRALVEGPAGGAGESFDLHLEDVALGDGDAGLRIKAAAPAERLGARVGIGGP
jgi:hypothetical protein